MATSDELRDKLVQALSDASAFGSPEDVADDVLPVVVEALAEAWDDGYCASNADHALGTTDEGSASPNPWRRP